MREQLYFKYIFLCCITFGRLDRFPVQNTLSCVARIVHLISEGRVVALCGSVNITNESVGRGECEEGEGRDGVEGNVTFTWISGPLLVG